MENQLLPVFLQKRAEGRASEALGSGTERVKQFQQQYGDKAPFQSDILIHIGEITGDYATLGMSGKQVWRVSEDGILRDTFRRLRYVFDMSESDFFRYYTVPGAAMKDNYLHSCQERLAELRKNIPDVPFSNIWLASLMAHRIPEGSTLHFGILNSLRSWNYFELPSSVVSACNVGGFGIDGGMSSLIGASLQRRS